jgi:hypothetical protein
MHWPSERPNGSPPASARNSGPIDQIPSGDRTANGFSSFESGLPPVLAVCNARLHYTFVRLSRLPRELCNAEEQIHGFFAFYYVTAHLNISCINLGEFGTKPVEPRPVLVIYYNIPEAGTKTTMTTLN